MPDEKLEPAVPASSNDTQGVASVINIQGGNRKIDAASITRPDLNAIDNLSKNSRIWDGLTGILLAGLIGCAWDITQNPDTSSRSWFFVVCLVICLIIVASISLSLAKRKSDIVSQVFCDDKEPTIMELCGMICRSWLKKKLPDSNKTSEKS